MIEVTDRIWCRPNQRYLRPLPARLGVKPRGRSRRLDRVLTDFGCEHSFARAAASVREHYGIEVSVSALRASTLEHAQRAHQQMQEQYEKSFRVLPTTGAAHVIAQADGTMIRTVEPGARQSKRPREWREMRLVAAQAKEATSAVYGATFGSVEQTGRRWGHCTRLAGWGANTSIHVLGDGAEWIRLQSQEVFQGQGHFLCDFYHVSQYLGAAADRCQPDRPHHWRRTQQKRLRRGAAGKVIETLEPFLEPPHTPDEEAPVRNAHRYLTNRLDCLDYPRALQLGLPIGSGLIESGHRHVLQARLKKPGCAWLQSHADHIAHLRVLRANQKWEAFWN